jgi:hypothetical protein
MSNPNYQYVYNVNLLDDLHNYFPDILYNQDRFQNMRDVLRYIREQTNNRFNLFQYGQSLYNDRDSVIEQQLLQPRMTMPRQTPIVTTPIFTPVRQEENISTTNLLLGLLGASMDSTPLLGTRLINRLNPNANPFVASNFLNPVIVRPTTEQIENNSEIVTDISGQLCTVCQDTISADDSCRRLRTCTHVFHRTCIDQWFLRSVSCPTCRRDVRE